MKNTVLKSGWSTTPWQPFINKDDKIQSLESSGIFRWRTSSTRCTRKTPGLSETIEHVVKFLYNRVVSDSSMDIVFSRSLPHVAQLLVCYRCEMESREELRLRLLHPRQRTAWHRQTSTSVFWANAKAWCRRCRILTCHLLQAVRSYYDGCVEIVVQISSVGITITDSKNKPRLSTSIYCQQPVTTHVH